MSTTPNNISYHDIGSLQQIRSAAGKDEAGALRQAAEQFESIFFSMLLGSMRKANEAFEVDGMMNSQTTKFYRDMQDSQMATELSKNGALGLADLLVQQLSPALGIKPDRQTPSELKLPQHNTDKVLAMPNVVLPAVQVKPLQQTGFTAPATVQPVSSQTEQTQPEWKVDSPADFVKNLLPAARQTAKALGLDPLALVAQAALETGWGQRMIKNNQGNNSFNLFGIKANNGWQGDTAVVDTLEYRGGIAKKEQARFRAYSSAEHSLQDYVNFIKQNPRYQEAVNASADTKAYFEQLQAAGYATDPAYAQKIMAVYQSPALQNARSDDSDTKEITHAAE
ncbi:MULTISPECIES: flagellar assembly peptidoglycan hydrolase FlgJ [Rheinheimera]|jgi:flagellar protein FlgJ|uniref:flagellar assembly peptidoglycan hydrolase FlgJ n=1 Tax=Rheinheimera TaxID=67575 RepID=UPI001065DC4C|nr:flagellar assembly peptidoglycan hydrolase FlgJ [Rheinheimera aquimaris]MCD1600439.1 flagellar assembly peptidoglycan hydrolase FlgJ [Rheinheimera aquimaris]